MTWSALVGCAVSEVNARTVCKSWCSDGSEAVVACGY